MTFRTTFEHRDELLRASASEFGERGYDNASVNRILHESGMSKGQLYHHFGSKEGLFLALVEWMVDRKLEWLASQSFAPVDDFFSALRSQITAGIDFATSRPDVDQLSRALLAERGRPIFATVVARLGFDADSALTGLVEQHYLRGAFRDDLSLEFVTRAVTTIVNHLPELLELDQPADLGPRVDEIVAFLRGGLLAR